MQLQERERQVDDPGSSAVRGRPTGLKGKRRSHLLFVVTALVTVVFS